MSAAGHCIASTSRVEKVQKIPVQIISGCRLKKRPYIRDVKNFITDFDLSANGKRVLITARGEIFSVPVKHGATRNISQNCGARDHEGIWSPDGKKVAYISDKTGEFELYTIDSEGGLRRSN